MERKKEIYDVCSRYDVVIVEDEPYWYLQFPSAAIEEAKSRGQPVPPPSPQPPKPTIASSGYPFLDSLTPSFLSLDTDGRVVRLDTFSKTVAPGCRLGWITAQPPLIERFERIAEATTQQPSGFVQGLISELVLGSSPQNQAAKSTFARLFSSSNPSQPPASSFSGWDTSGWIRWLEGLRGTYERRMARMCRILDSGSTLVTTKSHRNHPSSDTSSSEWSPVLISKKPLFTYNWPRGGMFIWLRVHLESHPLWCAPGTNPRIPVLNGPVLSTALMVWLTTKPFRVLVTTGSMFSANDEVRQREGWAFYRLCFAAETEENVDKAAERFVEGVHRFWEVRDAKVVEKLLGELGMNTSEGVEAGLEGLRVGEDVVRLGGFMGC